MTHLVRNDSSNVISSLQMDYSDSEEEESGSSRNTSRNNADNESEMSVDVPSSNILEIDSKDSTISGGERLPNPNDIIPPIDGVLGHEQESLLRLKPNGINAAPPVSLIEGSDKEAEGTPTDFISDDEDGGHHHTHHHHQLEKAKLLTEAVNTDSPSSQSSVPQARKATRLVSYGPDDDYEDEDDSESEVEVPFVESEENSPSINKTDTAALSRSVLNMSNEDIKIPPEPPGSCSYQLQKKIEDMYEKMRRDDRLDYNSLIQNKKNFRNPSIYEKLIEFCHIDEKGTNMPPEVYDPHIWGKESFYDELDKAQRKDMERREKEKKEKTKIEFVTVTKKSSSSSSTAPSDLPGYPDDKKRRTKWDAQPSGVSVSVIKAPGVQGPGVVNLTATATGTKATVISAVGSLSKKSGK